MSTTVIFRNKIVTTSQTPHQKILNLAKAHFKQQVSWRRYLHRHPEIANEETGTTAYLQKQVAKLKLKQLPIKMATGLLAELKGNQSGPVVALRTDIDALPITELTNLPYASETVGRMHACGHDMHMAAVLGAAAILSELKDELPGRVRFIFQPAEECPPGGARPMIANGALKNVEMIFGLHVDPELPTAKISLRDGPTMAAVIDFDLIIHGVGSHAARPHTGVDAIVAAAEVVESLQKIVARETDPFDSVVITIGHIEGGQARNIIADQVTIKGTARTLSPGLCRKLPKLIKRTASAICKARGAKLEMTLIADYPTLANDPGANAILKRNFSRLFGVKKIPESPQSMGGEDFACYLEKIPGAMFRLGIRNKKIGADKSWHSPHFVADENSLVYGSATLAAAAFDFLTGRNQ